MPKILCPGCGAEIDTDKEEISAEFNIKFAPQPEPVGRELLNADEDHSVVPAVAIPRRGSAFFKIRKEK